MRTRHKQPSGLRERKKSLQRHELLDTAMRLFRQDGYDTTRMDDIAAAADVSTKTVYNYFPTKQSLLAALLQEDRARMTTAYQAVLDDTPADLAEALAVMIRADLGDALTIEDKRLWRELMAAETRSHDRSDDAFTSNRGVFIGYIEKLLLKFRKNGVLSRSLSLPIASEMVYAIYSYDFRQYCSSETMTPDELFDLALAQMTHLVTSWRSDRRPSARPRAGRRARPTGARRPG